MEQSAKREKALAITSLALGIGSLMCAAIATSISLAVLFMRFLTLGLADALIDALLGDRFWFFAGMLPMTMLGIVLGMKGRKNTEVKLRHKSKTGLICSILAFLIYIASMSINAGLTQAFTKLWLQ